MTGIAWQRLCLGDNQSRSRSYFFISYQLPNGNLLEWGLTVKSHVKALGFYNFIRGFGWACTRGGLYPGGHISRIKNMFRNDETRFIWDKMHTITFRVTLYNTFIVRHNKQRMYFKNICKTLMRLEQLGTEFNESQKTTSLNVINLPVVFAVKLSSRWH